MKKLILNFSFMIAAALLVVSCADLKEDIPAVPEVNVHNDGYIQPSSANFHGTTIKGMNWNLENCQECHASDYSGGLAEVSCLGCHNQSDGPENCTTCHGTFNGSGFTASAPPQGINDQTATTDPGVGFHFSHLSPYTTYSDNIRCSSCHNVPSEWNSDGHLDGDSQAEVLFGYTDADQGSPAYSFTQNTCSGVYCHGSFEYEKPSDYKAYGYLGTSITGTDATVNWTGTAAGLDCNSCHGLAPTGHIAANVNECYYCHEDVVNSSGLISDTDLHMNFTAESISENKLQQCDYCHGDRNGTPFPIGDPHAQHMDAGEVLNASLVECEACHTVPAAYDAAGHFDATDDTEINWGSIASLSTADPVYDFNTMSCSDVYCHGDFRNGNEDNVVNWAIGDEAVACGTCHGDPASGNPLPKTSAEGGNHPNVPSCQFCHSDVVADSDGDGTYEIINNTKHINGKINVFGGEQDY